MSGDEAGASARIRDAIHGVHYLADLSREGVVMTAPTTTTYCERARTRCGGDKEAGDCACIAAAEGNAPTHYGPIVDAEDYR